MFIKQIKIYFSDTFESNIPKMFVHLFTERRNFIPLLSIYYLTLWNTLANELAIFTALGFLAWFLFEIPSGYISDTFGHKKTLILGKISLILSTLFFIIWSFLSTPLILFILGSIFLSIWFATNSGTVSAFIHETLEELGQEDKFTKILWRMKGKVSLLSVFVIFGLPFFTQIDILIPFYIALFLDIIGLINVFLLKSSTKYHQEQSQKQSFREIFKQAYILNFLPYAIIVGAIGWLNRATSAFRSPFLEELGLPLVLMGLAMALSRIVRFTCSYFIHIFDHITLKQYLLWEIILAIVSFSGIIYFKNPYVVTTLFAIAIWVIWWFWPVRSQLVLKNYVKNKKYKATVLSIVSQIGIFFQFSWALCLGYFMGISYTLGYTVLLIVLFLITSISWFFVKNN